WQLIRAPALELPATFIATIQMDHAGDSRAKQNACGLRGRRLSRHYLRQLSLQRTSSDEFTNLGNYIGMSGGKGAVGMQSYNLGSTGSLSSASTPKTHSWTRRSGSLWAKRSNASIPSANSRRASDRFAPKPRLFSRLKFCGSVYSGP